MDSYMRGNDMQRVNNAIRDYFRNGYKLSVKTLSVEFVGLEDLVTRLSAARAHATIE